MWLGWAVGQSTKAAPARKRPDQGRSGEIGGDHRSRTCQKARSGEIGGDQRSRTCQKSRSGEIGGDRGRSEEPHLPESDHERGTPLLRSLTSDGAVGVTVGPTVHDGWWPSVAQQLR